MRNKLVFSGKTFDSDSVKALELHLASSLRCAQLEADTLSAIVKSADKSIVRFTRNTPVFYYYREDVRFRGYLQSVIRIGPDTYTIAATSAVGLLMERAHPGGIYTGQTAETVIQEIVGTLPFVIKGTLRGMKLYGWLPYAKPPGKSARDNLSQVLFAIGASLKTGLDGVLRIVPLWGTPSATVAWDAIEENAKVPYAGAISSVSVTEHHYIAGGDEETLFEGDAINGDDIVFSEPMYGLAASGFSILAQNANYARLSGGSGVLKGTKYIHNTRQVVRPVTTGVPENIKTIEAATLVSLVNSNAVAVRMADYYRQNETIDCDIVLNRQAPGDVVNIYHPYDKDAVLACLETMDVTASGILMAHISALVGYTPPTTETVEYFDRREIFLQNTTFTVPDGVHSIRVVLIGGGDGGQGGSSGTAGTSGDRASTSGSGGSSSGSGGSPGQGGAAGAAGAGGKINILDISVEPGSQLSIAIGRGGAGGTNGSLGAAGGATTVVIDGQTHSSASGSSSSVGYVDTTTGDTYAKSGEAGLSGAAGGAAGSASSSGKPGGSVGGYSGGAGRSSKDVVDEYTSTGPYVFKSYSTKQQQVGYPSTITSIVTGYSSYRVDAEGRLFTSGSSTTIGYRGGSIGVVTGKVYKNPSNGGEAQGTTRTSKIEMAEVTAISGQTTQCRLTNYTITNTRLYGKGSVHVVKSILPGGGGGAASGASGGSAPSSSGGKGANARAASAPTTPGFGGNGGNGGGGGGAGGGGHVELIKLNSENFSVSASQNGGTGGAAGSGGAGSKGADGCVILYFGEPVKAKAGSPTDKHYRFWLDKLGRLLVT